MPSPPQRLISVWLPVPRRRTFTYALPPAWQEAIQPGQMVWVPLGRRKVVGMVEALQDQAPPEVGEIKEVLDFLPQECSLSPKLFQLFQWARGHYLAPPGEVLRAFFPTALLKGKSDKGEGARPRPHPEEFRDLKTVELNAAQEEAIAAVRSDLGRFQVHLLHGVTGSGKTEVYLRLCEAVLGRGAGGVLILVPEISLTPQIVGRFAARFGETVGVYHSGLTELQRFKTWWAAKEGRQRILIGTRSAVALPVRELALIVVDEEHDSSYKQEERFRYHGRDVAIMRSHLEGIPIVLGTATPSVETLENVENKKFRLLELPERATAGSLPTIHLIDLKENPPHPDTLLSEPLRARLEETLARGEQALLFLNRRGFAPFLLCKDCGTVPRCPNCEISLTYHRRPLAMKCHYCEFTAVVPETCTSCRATGLEPIGVGTEQLEAHIARDFPGTRVGRLDRDVVTSRQRTEDILSQFSSGQLDVLVGTQLVTKGHDFKRLTLVGILLADLALHLPDFRAAERVFQMVTQVAGRAGRHDLPGEVFLQTFRPDHFAIQSALNQDGEQFFVQERSYRRELNYPPFGRIVLLRFTGSQAPKVSQACEEFANKLKVIFQNHNFVQILGPAKATLEKLRGKFRWQILVKTERFEALRRMLEDKIPHLENQIPAGVQLAIDVDPIGIF